MQFVVYELSAIQCNVKQNVAVKIQSDNKTDDAVNFLNLEARTSEVESFTPTPAVDEPLHLVRHSGKIKRQLRDASLNDGYVSDK